MYLLESGSGKRRRYQPEVFPHALMARYLICGIGTSASGSLPSASGLMPWEELHSNHMY